MRTFRRTMSALVVLALLATSTGLGATRARAADEEPPVSTMVAIGPGLVTGPQAREVFEALARDGAVTFTDFESVPTGPRGQLKLDGPATGITVRMRTTEFRYPLPPKRAPKDTPVIVLPHSYVSEPTNHRLMGSNPGDIPDGQAKYKLVLSGPVSHAGLLRMWNTNSLTRFYDADGTLLADHRNTENQEFVGYVAAGPGDRVKTIEFDGVPEDPKSKGNKIFQVGEVDDLYLGSGTAEAGAASEEELSSGDEPYVDESGEAWASGVSEAQGGIFGGLTTPTASRSPAAAALLLTLAVLSLSRNGNAEHAGELGTVLLAWLLNPGGIWNWLEKALGER